MATAQATTSSRSNSPKATAELFDLAPTDGQFDSTVERLEALLDITGLAASQHTLFVESYDALGHFGVPTAIFLDLPELALANPGAAHRLSNSRPLGSRL